MKAACPICEVVAGRVAPVGGLLPAPKELVCHAVLGPCPVPGWTVVSPRRHVEQLADLTEEETGILFRWGRRVAEAQRQALDAEKSYLAIFAEQVPHLHLHVVPRDPGTPADLRGPRVFLAGADRAQEEADLAMAVASLRDVLVISDD